MLRQNENSHVSDTLNAMHQSACAFGALIMAVLKLLYNNDDDDYSRFVFGRFSNTESEKKKKNSNTNRI